MFSLKVPCELQLIWSGIPNSGKTFIIRGFSNGVQKGIELEASSEAECTSWCENIIRVIAYNKSERMKSNAAISYTQFPLSFSFYQNENNTFVEKHCRLEYKAESDNTVFRFSDLIPVTPSSGIIGQNSVSRFGITKKASTVEDDNKIDGIKIAKLTLKVIDAKELINMELIGLNDPYVVIEYGKLWKCRTETLIDSGSVGQWITNDGNESMMQFEISEEELRSLVMKVYVVEANRFKNDVEIGRANCSLSGLLANGLQNDYILTFDITNISKRVKGGVVTLTFGVTDISTGTKKSNYIQDNSATKVDDITKSDSSNVASTSTGPSDFPSLSNLVPAFDDDEDYRPLPSGWVRRLTAKHEVVYVNHSKKLTQWNFPGESPSKVPTPHIYRRPLPEGWEMRTNQNNEIYFANTITKSTQWQIPDIE
jgi:hypothetical protein